MKGPFSVCSVVEDIELRDYLLKIAHRTFIWIGVKVVPMAIHWIHHENLSFRLATSVETQRIQLNRLTTIFY